MVDCRVSDDGRQRGARDGVKSVRYLLLCQEYLVRCNLDMLFGVDGVINGSIETPANPRN